MVTPEEREAELRASSQWPTGKAEPSPPAPQPDVSAEPPPTEPTPSRHRASSTSRSTANGPGAGRTTTRVDRPAAITEYDPLTGELIGDGYRRYEDDEW
jgi:hypothetical protein